jgi:hypothetical protein
LPPSRKTKMKIESTSIRFGSRVRAELAVELSVDTRTAGRGILRNASISGALIETALELPLHTNLLVTLTIPGDESPTARSLAACVVRLDPAGVGVEWRDVGGADIVDLLDRAASHQAMV